MMMKSIKNRDQKRIQKDDEMFLQHVFLHYVSYGRHDLPWRKTITPYRILISEVMLQQTQVGRVLEKFVLWMKRYPTLTALRNASLREVLILWQGLGYQRRAKALLAIASIYKTLPKTHSALCELPGVGKYTASALCAFAYNEFTYPVLETNIRTALIEYFHEDKETVHDGLLLDDLTRLTQYEQVKRYGARDFYYALMDYGAHLKREGISHNKKSAHHRTATTYKGSKRELRAKVLFAITKQHQLPKDERVNEVLEELLREQFIIKKGKGYVIP